MEDYRPQLSCLSWRTEQYDLLIRLKPGLESRKESLLYETFYLFMLYMQILLMLKELCMVLPPLPIVC